MSPPSAIQHVVYVLLDAIQADFRISVSELERRSASALTTTADQAVTKFAGLFA